MMGLKVSIERICGVPYQDAELLLYGRTACSYIEITRDLRSGGVKHLFDYRIGGGSFMMQTLHSNVYSAKTVSQKVGRVCKNALAMVALENYKRTCQGRPLIWLIFCVDQTGVASLTSQAMTGRHCMNSVYTSKEIRRVEKLCNDPDLPEELKITMRKVCKFVHVEAKWDEKQHQLDYNLTLIPSPWENEKYRAGFVARAVERAERVKTVPYKESNFRRQLNAAVQAYDTRRAQLAKDFISFASYHTV